MDLLRTLRRLPAVITLAIGLAAGAASTASHAADEAPKVAAAQAAQAAAPAENPYGLKAMVEHGDLVSKGVLSILMVMSMGTWYLLVTKLIEQRRLLSESKAVSPGAAFWTAADLRQGAESLDKEGAFRFIADTAFDASQKHGGILASVDRGSWISTAVDEAGEEVEHRLQKGLAFLATVGSTSPFIGLFGTVWGILNALTAIGVAGQASIDKVAGPVGEALIMTAIGLAVAVPAVLGYNWLVGRNTTALHHVSTFGSRLRAALLATPVSAQA
jgi:biopolymer transport protein ExbB